MPIPRLLVCLLAAALSALPSTAQASAGLSEFLSAQFPDNSDVRQRFFTSLITAPKETVWAFKEERFPSKAGSVLVRSLRRSEDFFIQFLNARGDSHPEAGRGSYIIERGAAKGFLVQAKIFLFDDPSCYVRIYPQAEGTRLDLILYGAVLKRGLAVSGMFYNVLTRPFSELVAATSRSVDWAGVFGLGAADLAASIRAQEPGRAEEGLSLLEGASTVEELLLAAAGRGREAAELSGPFAALGLAEDREVLTTRLPYAAFPRYEPRAGIPAAALRAALFLASQEAPGSLYALFGGEGPILAAPAAPGGGSGFAFFLGEEEIPWPELAARLAGRRIRIVRI